MNYHGRVYKHRPLGLLLAALLGISGIVGAQPAQVLVIHSYGTDFQWTRDLDTGIRQVLQADPEDYAAVYSEYLDSKYHTSEEYFAARAAMLQEKYQDWDFDVLIVTDNIGLEFVRQYRDTVFGELPTVFAGINRYEPALVEGLTKVTGIPEQVSAAETLSLVLSLFPEGRLIILGDGTVTYRRNEALFRDAVATLDANRELLIFPELKLDQLPLLAADLRDGDVVFLASSVLEVDGRLADFWRAGALVSAAVPVPVFVFWDFFMGTGVAGGYLASGVEQGAAAGELALRILAGEPPEEISVVTASPNRWVFDMAPLREAGVDVDDLPDGSVVINASPSIWRDFRGEILLVAIVLVTMVSLLVLLMATVRRRAAVALRLRESLTEKEILLKEIHHRVKNNLQVISSILSLQRSFVVDTQSAEYFKDCETRVQSMALVHEQLYQGRTLAKIDMAEYLNELLASLVAAMTSPNFHLNVETQVDTVSLTLDQAIPVGLVINELVSNVIKYAYPGAITGSVQVLVARQEAGVTVRVRDWGVGLHPNSEPRSSLGLQLVDALAAQLKGRVEYTDPGDGLEVVFTIPLPEE